MELVQMLGPIPGAASGEGRPGRSCPPGVHSTPWGYTTGECQS